MELTLIHEDSRENLVSRQYTLGFAPVIESFQGITDYLSEQNPRIEYGDVAQRFFETNFGSLNVLTIKNEATQVNNKLKNVANRIMGKAGSSLMLLFPENFDNFSIGRAGSGATVLWNGLATKIENVLISRKNHKKHTRFNVTLPGFFEETGE